jgi:hypothetical protein
MSRLTGRVNRLASQVLNGREPDLAAEAQAFGELVSNGPHVRVYERHEDGVLVSSLVVPGLVYELVGVHLADLV